MAKSERTTQSPQPGQRSPGDSFAAHRSSSVHNSGSVRNSLITNRPWNDYDLESLLPLREVYQENTKFGFLLRHYWIPATELLFRRSRETTFSDGNMERQELRIKRKMAPMNARGVRPYAT